jgi:hypothetical protein
LTRRRADALPGLVVAPLALRPGLLRLSQPPLRRLPRVARVRALPDKPLGPAEDEAVAVRASPRPWQWHVPSGTAKGSPT